MKNLLIRPFGVIFWLHIVFVVGAALSPLWLDWKLVFAIFILLNVQWFLLGGCFLTFLETGKDKDMTYEYYYLSRVWPNIHKIKVKIIVTYILPITLVVTTYILQIKLGWQPLLNF